jgi:membrane associated rhomboid family serine protease
MDFNITTLIILITCGVSFWAWNNHELYKRLIFNPYAIFHRKEYYRLFSSALLHADMPHLIINMFVLFSFGRVIERAYHDYIPLGVPMYLILYVLSIAAANLKTLFENKDNVWYNAVGASGAVSAVVFSFVLFAPKEEILFFGIIPIPAFLYGLLYLVYSQYMAKKGNDNIGHDAHFYGAIFGFVFTGLLRPELFQLFVKQILNF